MRTTPQNGPQAAWCRLPNSLVDDLQVTAEMLFFLAHRATFAIDRKPYRIIGGALARQRIAREGFGHDVIKRSIRGSVGAGYLERRQPPSRGYCGFGKVEEKLHLPPCNWRDREAWRFVSRHWFDGTLSVKEMAVWLYLRARAGRLGIFGREVAARFRWSPPTTRKVLAALIELKLVAVGFGRRYRPLPPDAVWPPPASEKIHPTKNPESEKSQPTKSDKIHPARSEKIHPTDVSYGVKDTKRAHARVAATLAAPALGAATLAAADEGTPSVASFLAASANSAVQLAPPEPAAPGTLARVEAVATNEELTAAIKTAAGGDARLQAALDALHASLRGGGKLNQTAAAA